MSTDVTSVTKSLDRIADALEGGSSGGGSGGGGGSVLVVHAHDNEEGTQTTLDKTFNEIKNAIDSGVKCLFDTSYIAEEPENNDIRIGTIQGYQIYNGLYIVYCYAASGGVAEGYHTDSADGYPFASWGD